MLKYVLCLGILAIPLHVVAQEQVVTSTRPVPIRFSPPSPWLLGFPGWEVAQTTESEEYQVLRTLEIYAFSSTQIWVEVESLPADGDSQAGWVYWGDSLNDSPNFEVIELGGEHQPEVGERPDN